MNSIGVDCVHKSPFKGALTYKSRFYFGIGITYKNDQKIPPFRGCFNCTHFGNNSQCHCELSPPIWNDSRVNDSTCCFWTNHCLGCSSYTNSCFENPPQNRVLSVAITLRLVRHIIIEFANFLLSKRLFDSSNGLRKIFVLYLRSHKTSRMYANRLEFSNLEAGQKYDILRFYLERRNITQIWVCRELHPKLCLTWSNSQQTSHMHDSWTQKQEITLRVCMGTRNLAQMWVSVINVKSIHPKFVLHEVTPNKRVGDNLVEGPLKLMTNSHLRQMYHTNLPSYLLFVGSYFM